jgi:hypothetical protein
VRSGPQTYLLVASDAGVTMLDEQLHPAALWPKPTHLLEPLNETTVLAATRDRRIVALTPP